MSLITCFEFKKKLSNNCLSQLAEEKLSNIRTVRAFAHEDKECKTYEQKIQDVLKLSYKESLARGIFFGFVKFFDNFLSH